jgi:phenylacetate-CoA ligase
VRRVPEVIEFRSTVGRQHEMRTVSVEVEIAAGTPGEAPIVARVARELREALGLTVPVRAVPAGTLPRSEMKSRRFVVEE